MAGKLTAQFTSGPYTVFYMPGKKPRQIMDGRYTIAGPGVATSAYRDGGYAEQTAVMLALAYAAGVAAGRESP